LQAASQLLCPKCGFKMQGRAPAQPAPSPAKAPVAPAKPIAPTQPAPAKPVVASAKPVAVAPKPAVAPAVPAPTVAMATPVQAAPKLATPVNNSPSPPMAMPLPAKTPAPATAVATGEPPAPSKAASEGSIPDGVFFNPTVGEDAGPLVRTLSKPKRKFSWMKALIMTLAVGFAACIVIVAFGLILIAFRGLGPLGGGDGDVRGNLYYGQVKGSKDANERVYKLALVKEEWEIDRDVQSRFEALNAWKHKEYDFWFAVVVQDFGMSKPRDSEMLRTCIDKLEGFFGDALELGKKAEPTKIKDLPAQKIQFKGQIKSANWLGECYMFFNNGIAYWLFIASPDWATVEHFADELPKKNFFVESERRGWREQPPPMESFSSKDGKINVTVPKSVWEKTPNAKDIDENGVLFLFGRYAKEKDNRKNASLLVFTFERKEDLKSAMKAARDYVDNKVKNDNENYKVAIATDVSPGQTEIGVLENIGNRPGRLIDLKRLFNDEPQRYFLLTVVNEADSGYAVLSECSWDSRQIWRQDFLDVMRSMKFKAGE